MIGKDMKRTEYFAYTVLAIVLALMLSGVFILILGKNPLQAFTYIFAGGFGRVYALGDLVVKSTPLILMGLGVSLCFKAGLTNLGGDGQFYMGAIASSMVGLGLYGMLPTPVLFVIVLLAGALAGGIWGGMVGVVKAKLGTNEIIMTLMTNFIALYILRYLLEGPCMDPNVYLAQTAEVPKALRFARLVTGLRINTSFIIVILAVAVVYYIVRKTVWGYNIEVLGNAPRATQYAGIGKTKYIVALLFTSGALSGLAGYIEVYAIQFRTLEGITAEYGFTAIIISLLANKNPLGVVIAAIFISGLQIGANSMQVEMGIPSSIISLTLGFVILLLMIVPTASHNIKLRRYEKALLAKSIDSSLA